MKHPSYKWHCDFESSKVEVQHQTGQEPSSQSDPQFVAELDLKPRFLASQCSFTFTIVSQAVSFLLKVEIVSMCRRQYSVTSTLHTDYNRVITFQLISPRYFSPEFTSFPFFTEDIDYWHYLFPLLQQSNQDKVFIGRLLAFLEPAASFCRISVVQYKDSTGDVPGDSLHFSDM